MSFLHGGALLQGASCEIRASPVGRQHNAGDIVEKHVLDAKADPIENDERAQNGIQV
jgi:hypothetical protein